MCMAVQGGPANISYLTPPPGEGQTFSEVIVADITPYGAIGQTFIVPVDLNITAVEFQGFGPVRPFPSLEFIPINLSEWYVRH